MTDVREATAEFLADKSEFENDLRAVLEIDEDGPWTLEDVPLDSGHFGEIVSRDIVKSVDGGYRIADRDAVQEALDGNLHDEDQRDSASKFDVSVVADTVSSRLRTKVAVALLGALALVIIARTGFVFTDVLREGDVALAGNDPYKIRYQVEQLVRSNLTPFDIRSLGLLPDGIAAEDVSLVVSLWWITALFGGGTATAGHVLAWYPVVAAVITAGFLYLLAVRLTGDRRVGLATVVILAVTPVHAYRTMLGFADHHAFDYVWLAMTATSLVALAVESQTSNRGGFAWPGTQTERVAVVGTAVGITAQVYAWSAGPILLVPVGIYAVYRSLSDLRAKNRPLSRNAPLIFAVGLAAVLTAVPYLAWGWAQLYRAVAPTLLLGGVAVSLAVSEGARRRGLSPRAVAGLLVALFGCASLFLWAAVPVVSENVSAFVVYLFSGGDIAETMSLVDGGMGSVFGPVLLFGFVFFLALPYATWIGWRTVTADRPAWFVPVGYAVWFLGLSVVQLRFAGQLSLFLAVFAGLGFVHLAARVDIVDPPAILADNATTAPTSDGRDVHKTLFPTAREFAALGMLFLLVSGLGLVQVPVKQSQLTVDDSAYETATWMDEHAADQGWSYPRNYVFSEWGANRMYNYFVNGQAGGYGFAKANYGAFLTGTDGYRWYQRLRDKVGFIVTMNVSPVATADSLQTRLHRNHGSRDGEVPGLGHYRTVFVSEDRSQAVATLVPGATITGIGPENSTITVETNVSVNSGTFTYTRRVETTPRGWYAVTVPYTGTFDLWNDSVQVSSTEISAGKTFKTIAPNGSSYWPFGEGTGDRVYDVFSGEHGRLLSAQRTSGVDGRALRFSGGREQVRVSDHSLEGRGSRTISFWIRGNLSDTSEPYPTVLAKNGDNSNLGIWARRDAGDFGVRLDYRNQTVRNFGIESTNFKKWTMISVVLDDCRDEVRLYRNGSLVSRSTISTLPPSFVGDLYLGSRGNSHFASFDMDELRIYDSALNQTDIEERYESETASP